MATCLIDFETRVYKMAELLTTLPTDITMYINEKVQELHETEYRKITLKKLANEAARHMTCVLGEEMEWHSDDLHLAWEALQISEYEEEYGPSGDRGEYESQPLERSQAEYQDAVEAWNNFIDNFQHLSHLLRGFGFHAERFKHRSA